MDRLNVNAETFSLVSGHYAGDSRQDSGGMTPWRMENGVASSTLPGHSSAQSGLLAQ